MRGWPGRERAISRKTVRPPTPLSKTPIGALFDGFGDTRPTLTFDSVLFDFLVEVRSRRVDRLGGLRHIPAVLAQLREDEGLLRLVLEVLQLRKMHGAGDDLRRGTEELRGQ